MATQSNMQARTANKNLYKRNRSTGRTMESMRGKEKVMKSQGEEKRGGGQDSNHPFPKSPLYF